MIGGSDFSNWWGYPGAQDLLVQIVARAIKHGGFHVVLLQPGTEYPACTATDTAIKRGHLCSALRYPWGHDMLTPDPERPQRIKPQVTAAVGRVTERYGGVPNVAISLHASNMSHATIVREGCPPTLFGPFSAWLQSGTEGRGGIVPVPPSVLRGEPVRCWSIHGDPPDSW